MQQPQQRVLQEVVVEMTAGRVRKKVESAAAVVVIVVVVAAAGVEIVLDEPIGCWPGTHSNLWRVAEEEVEWLRDMRREREELVVDALDAVVVVVAVDEAVVATNASTVGTVAGAEGRPSNQGEEVAPAKKGPKESL